MIRALALLALLCVVPFASAQQGLTLDDLEAPTKGTPDQTWKVQVEEDQSKDVRAIVFRNPVRYGFGLTVIDARGTTVFEENGSRGIQQLGPLSPGEYTFLMRFREGEFQVVGRTFGFNLNESVNTTVEGGADAYLVRMTKNHNFTVSGDVDAEWFDIQRIEPEHPAVPFTRTAVTNGYYVLTVTGAAGTPYAINVEETTYSPPVATPDHSGHDETPGVGAVLLLAAVGALALARRRR